MLECGFVFLRYMSNVERTSEWMCMSCVMQWNLLSGFRYYYSYASFRVVVAAVVVTMMKLSRIRMYIDLCCAACPHFSLAFYDGAMHHSDVMITNLCTAKKSKSEHKYMRWFFCRKWHKNALQKWNKHIPRLSHQFYKSTEKEESRRSRRHKQQKQKLS